MRILHFVTGGFSGATQVAINLCLSAHQSGTTEVLLVLRRKRNTDLERVTALRNAGLDVRIVPGWAHAATILVLYRIARSWKPDILVAHGFSEHLWGRYAGLLAGVTHMVHVEHNSRERYTRWRLAQARWLAQRTDAMVGVSLGVAQVLQELGFPAKRCHAIPNGIDLQRFPESRLQAWEQRENAIVMAARFAQQKDHDTLIRAMSLLATKGLRPQLYLAGTGKKRIQNKLERLVQKLGLTDQVKFLGQVADVPGLLMGKKIFILSTHYEGFPLALAEAMAAGCACIGSDVVGVREVIRDQENGLLVPEGNAEAMASALQQLLESPELTRRLGATARTKAMHELDSSLMLERYEQLFRQITTIANPEHVSIKQ